MRNRHRITRRSANSIKSVLLRQFPECCPDYDECSGCHQKIRGRTCKQHAVDTVKAAFGEFRLKISNVNLVLDMQKNLVKATISVAIKDYPIGVESAAYDNVYKAIDEVVTKAETQARKYLDKKQEHRSVGLKDLEGEKAANAE